MLMKVQSADHRLLVINTDQVCRVEDLGSRAQLIQTDGKPVGIKITAGEYYNLVVLSEEQAEDERAKRRSRRL